MIPSDDLIKEKEQLEGEMNVVVQMTHDIIAENARIAQDQTVYQKRYSGVFSLSENR